MVCTGNICRSPMAEAVLKHELRKAGRDWTVDSAGTGGWHEGESADPRTVKVLARHGVPPPSRARQIRAADGQNFDLILAMDRGHLRDLESFRSPAEVRLFLAGADTPVDEVPDPYYGDITDFEYVFTLVKAGVDNLLKDA